ncbi:MAG TPA: hypothetical protein VKI00_22935, partial [Mycobacterium sp.]|uniref:hypothetical protein n=1 Tax=Mycobacterium sp. TaxID=1785 RepID=UPI002BB7EE5B
MSRLVQQFAAGTAPGAGGDVITQLMRFFGKQPQLVVCGQLGLPPLTAQQRRELLAGINLYDALETVAGVQG